MNTDIQWGIWCPDNDTLDYDDEQDARDHLPLHPDGRLVKRTVTVGPWQEVEG